MHNNTETAAQIRAGDGCVSQAHTGFGKVNQNQHGAVLISVDAFFQNTGRTAGTAAGLSVPAMEPPSRNGAIHNSHDKESRISRIRLMDVAR